MSPERWREVEALYHAALERGREALETVDPELRREVESLLAQEGATLPSLGLQPVPAQVGQYRIEEKLGEGGMGVVYRALDTKLNRPVAIKFLPEDLADAAARRRFQREAQTASSLNHPHIVTVHDAGEIEGRQYIVTEYIDGGTLRDWAKAEKRTWRQVVELLTGVADALAAAHEAKILHRDIKPANILITRNGYAKLADFGLAKLAEGVEEPDATRTLTDGRTKAGVVIGTIAYMSPEQASGQRLDARSDIFSFGVMLYELLAGRRPFHGKSDLETLQSILHGPPEPLGEDTPAPLRGMVEKALEKDPGERYQAMREMVVDLRRLARWKQEQVTPAPAASPRARPWLWASIAGLAALAALSAWLMRGTPGAIDNPLANARFTRFTDFEGDEHGAAISPDGKFVAFRSDRDGPLDVWVSQVGSGQFLNRTQGIDDEFSLGLVEVPSVGFTSDGSQLWLAGAPDGRRFRLLPLIAGPPRLFLPEHTVAAAWSWDGTRVVYHTYDDGDPTFVGDPAGANPRQLTHSPPGEHNHHHVWSPDGRWIYFVSGHPATAEMDLWRVSPGGGDPERLTQHRSVVAHPAPIDGRTVLYVAPDQDGSGPWLWALDVERKSTRRISFGLEKYTSLAASANGQRLVATVANPVSGLFSVPILDRLAEERDVRRYSLPALDSSSPRFGGRSLFYLSSPGAGAGLWSFQDGRAREIWKGADNSVVASPAVALDGRRIAITLLRGGESRLHVLSSDGAEMQPIADAIDVRGAPCWSPDGKWLLTAGRDAAGPGLFKIPAGGGAPDRIVQGPALNPVWSPDGGLIVYSGADISGNAPLLAVRPDGSAVQVPEIRLRRGGERVRFLPGGTALVYMQGFRRVQDFWLLDLRTMKSRQLTRLNDPAWMRTFDITPDGKQIVFDRLRENSDIVLIDLPERGK
jgi:serine/threonine protein kinase/Tol biopolymer transport system component